MSQSVQRPPSAPARGLLACALALCALALLAGAGSAAARPRASAAGSSIQGGVNVPAVSSRLSPGQIAREIAYAARLHAKLVRLAVPWAMLEPARGTIETQAQADLDHVVEDAAADGIRVVAMVYSTPCWASSAPARTLRRCKPGRETAADAWPPTQASAFGSFCAYLAQRYGTRLAAIEIWNEPDEINEAYLAGPAKPAHYAALLRAAYPAIKQAAPGVAVLAGSLVGSNGVFLKALYAAGIKGYYDGLAVHYYHLTLASVRSIHEVQLANGDNTPLWLDEFGWSSCWPARKLEQEQACVTPRTQAQNVTNTFRALARAPYVAAAVLYKLQDTAAESFGVLSAAGHGKPSFAALASAFSDPLGRISPVTLSLRRRGSSVVASGSAPVGDFMALEAFQGSALRYRALFTLNRFNRYSLTLPAALGTSGLRVRVYQFWAGASRDAQKSI